MCILRKPGKDVGGRPLSECSKPLGYVGISKRLSCLKFWISVLSQMFLISMLQSKAKHRLGRAKGWAQGCIQGWVQGWAQGWVQGWAQGWVQGSVQGRVQVKVLQV